MCKVISICNQKGGVAKTTTAVNLGIGLAKEGNKVCLVDCDAQGSMTIALGYKEPDRIEVTLATLLSEIIKIIYFDEQAAQDYLDITNGGRLDWTKEENKKRAAEILTEIEAHAKGGFNILEVIKASLSGNINAKGSGEIAHIFDSTIKNTLLTDYLDKVKDAPDVKKFNRCVLYAPATSASMYKMVSSYLTIVPKEQMPIDMEKLNSAVLSERGYYSLLVDGDDKTVLRFNIKAFSNNYGLADIGKMKLTCYGVSVGECEIDDLSIENEFGPVKKNEVVTAESVVDGADIEMPKNKLQIYDVVLAGVEK